MKKYILLFFVTIVFISGCVSENEIKEENAIIEKVITEDGGIVDKSEIIEEAIDLETEKTFSIPISGNMLMYPYSETTKEQNGITFTDNGDGSITLNGKATNNANFYFISAKSENSNIDLFSTGEYYLSGAIKDKCSLIVCYREDGKNIDNNQVDRGNGVFFNVDSNSDKYNGISVEVFVRQDTKLDNLTIYPMLVRLNTDDLEWRPYLQ